ncbi:MAG: hypothetical protein ACT4NU_05530 [Chromatiales bacterium]
MFVASTVIEREVVRQFDVEVLARTNEVREQYYAITADRRIEHPGVLAISRAARHRLTV